MFRKVLHGKNFYLFLIYSYIPFEFLILAHAELRTLLSPIIKMSVVLFIVQVIMRLRLKKHISLPKKSYLNNMRGAY